jgi:hypothetical protein
MRQQATRELLAYWNRLRGTRPAPDRAEIDLAAIRGSLADLFVLDLDAARQFPFLMAGTRLNAFFCAELLGRSFLSLWAPQDARAIAAGLLTVVDSACPIIAASAAHPEGYRDADIEILLLPLRHAGFSQARILGLATPALQPPWAGLLPVPHLALRAMRTVEAEIGWARPANASLFPDTPYVWNARRPTDIRGHLRIFDGGK